MISRYSRPEMASLWSPEARLRRWRDVELAALEGMVEAGIAPAAALQDCRAKAGDFDAKDVARIDEIERVTKHDVIAFLTFLEERIGPSARWLHLGMTSSDVLDTALGMTLRDAANLLLEGIRQSMSAVRTRAFEHKKTPMIGRSHGIHAEPITLGLKLAIWYDELRRSQRRLEHARDAVAVGKISGAVGTFAHLPPSVEAHACKVLGLKPAPASNAIAMPSSLQFWRCWAPRSRNSPPRFGISSGRRSGRRKSRLPRGKRARPRCRTSAIQFFPKT